MGVTPEFIQGELARASTYAVVLLKDGPNAAHPDRDALTGAHVVRNFELKVDGAVAVVGPMRTDSDIRGLYIFNRSPEEAVTLIEGDPAVEAGIFVYEVHEMMAFPGDTLS